MINDLRYAAHTLLRSRGFAAVAIVTLALGIGANTAIFSVVNGVLLRPLPYPDSDRIVRLASGSASDPQGSFSPPDFLDIDRDIRSLAPIAGYRRDAVTIAVPGGEPRRVAAASVTADYFDVFAMPALVGRAFTAADQGSTEPTIVVSQRVWERELGSDPAIAGRRIKVNGVPHTVLGVMPAGFDYPEDNGVWVRSPMVVPTSPLNVPGDLLSQRDVHYFEVVGRLKAGASLASARAELDALAARQARDFPQTNQGRTIGLRRLDDVIVGGVRSALLMLLGAVGLVLLIACANVASLLLARASERQREIAVRSALGASRAHLMRQLLAESLLLGAVGGLVGLFAAAWAVAGLVSALPAGIPRADAIHLDLRVCGAAVLIAFASALLFGLVPAWQGSRATPASVLHDASGDRGATGGRRRARTRAAFVVAEIALTLVLLVGAGLLVNSFVRLQRVDPGFRVDGLTMVTLPLPQSQYPDGPKQAAFYRRVLDGIRQRPGIGAAAVLFPGPFQATNASGSFSIEGRGDTSRPDAPTADLMSISPGFFRAMGIPIVKGRDITDQDREPAPAVVLVNQALARKYFPGGDPLGTRLRFGDTDEDWMTIVGVVADSRTRDLDEIPAPLLYIPYPLFTVPFMTVVARTDAGPGVVASAVREEVKAIDPEMPVDTVRPMREVIADRTAGARFRTLLVGAFGLMALLLATVGVYGLVSYSVAQRTREFGIRMALGAHPRQVIAPVLKEGLGLGVLGVGIGALAAVYATRLLEGFLFGVEATDPLTFAAVAALLLAVAVIASYIPSRRALKIDPIVALKGS